GYPSYRVRFEPVIRVGHASRIFGVVACEGFWRETAQVYEERSIVLQYDVHVAVPIDVRVICVRALQKRLALGDRIRCRAFEKVGAHRPVRIRELAGPALGRPRFELPFRNAQDCSPYSRNFRKSPSTSRAESLPRCHKSPSFSKSASSMSVA